VFCHHCGAELKIDARFCSKCGVAVENNIKKSTVSNEQSSIIDQKSHPSEAIAKQRLIRSSSSWRAIILVIVLIVVLGGVAARASRPSLLT